MQITGLRVLMLLKKSLNFPLDDLTKFKPIQTTT